MVQLVHHQEDKQMTIKKAFQPIVSLLEEADPSTTVADILPQVIELTKTARGSGGGGVANFHRNDDNEVVAIRCGYYKKWFDPREVAFGLKSSSASGYHTMCKEGVANWVRQNKEQKQAREQLLRDVANGEIDAADVPAVLAQIDEDAKAILDTDLVGYDTLEELLQA